MMQLVAKAMTQDVQSMIDGLAALTLISEKVEDEIDGRYGRDPIDQNLERWRQGIGGESEVKCNSLTFRAQPRYTILIPVTFVDEDP